MKKKDIFLQNKVIDKPGIGLAGFHFSKRVIAKYNLSKKSSRLPGLVFFRLFTVRYPEKMINLKSIGSITCNLRLHFNIFYKVLSITSLTPLNGTIGRENPFYSTFSPLTAFDIRDTLSGDRGFKINCTDRGRILYFQTKTQYQAGSQRVKIPSGESQQGFLRQLSLIAGWVNFEQGSKISRQIESVFQKGIGIFQNFHFVEHPHTGIYGYEMHLPPTVIKSRGLRSDVPGPKQVRQHGFNVALLKPLVILSRWSTGSVQKILKNQPLFIPFEREKIWGGGVFPKKNQNIFYLIYSNETKPLQETKGFNQILRDSQKITGTPKRLWQRGSHIVMRQTLDVAGTPKRIWQKGLPIFMSQIFPLTLMSRQSGERNLPGPEKAMQERRANINPLESKPAGKDRLFSIIQHNKRFFSVNQHNKKEEGKRKNVSLFSYLTSILIKPHSETERFIQMAADSQKITGTPKRLWQKGLPIFMSQIFPLTLMSRRSGERNLPGSEKAMKERRANINPLESALSGKDRLFSIIQHNKRFFSVNQHNKREEGKRTHEGLFSDAIRILPGMRKGELKIVLNMFSNKVMGPVQGIIKKHFLFFQGGRNWGERLFSKAIYGILPKHTANLYLQLESDSIFPGVIFKTQKVSNSVPNRDTIFTQAGAHSPILKELSWQYPNESMNFRPNKPSALIFRKPETPEGDMALENKRSFTGEKQFSTSVSDNLIKDYKKISILEANRIADKVYKIIEKKIAIEKDRRGLR